MSVVLSGASFARATKRRSRLRLALCGPSGSGKTYTALSIATHLAGPIAVIDTERGSASKYADDPFTFDVLELSSYSPQRYTEAIEHAAAAGYGTLIIDSLSHAWMGRDGALEMVDNATKRSRSSNSFSAWGEVTPHHYAMIDAILQAPMHVIVTMRVKMAYVVETNRDGKQVPRKVGLQPVQRDGVEYEFDVVADLTSENEMVVGKTRCPAIRGKVFPNAGKEVAGALNHWLDAGAPEDAAATLGDILQPAVTPRDVVQRPATPRVAPPPAEYGPRVNVAERAFPGSPPPVMTALEARAVEQLTPRFASAGTVGELQDIMRTARRAAGSKPSETFRRWYEEQKAQAQAAIGAPSDSAERGPAKTASAVASKAVAS